MDNFPEEIKGMRRTTFTVSSISVKTLKEFKKFCQEECNDCYATGISYLLSIKNQWDNLVPLLSSVLQQVPGEIEEESNSKEIKTFGDE